MTKPNDKRGFPSEMHRRQHKKNRALLLMLLVWVLIFYVVSILRIGGGS